MTTKVGSSVLGASLTLVTPNLGTPTTLVGTNITGTAASLTVGNATTASNLNGTWNQMPAGTTTNFYQAAAPTGWVQRTDLNDFMMYIVSGQGGGSGGSASPILNNTVPYHTHGFSTGGFSADHSHSVGDPGHSHTFPSAWRNSGGSRWSGSAGPIGDTVSGTDASATGIWLGGSSSNHSHSGGTDGGSSQTNWAPRYLSNIMCYKS